MLEKFPIFKVKISFACHTGIVGIAADYSATAHEASMLGTGVFGIAADDSAEDHQAARLAASRGLSVALTY